MALLFLYALWLRPFSLFFLLLLLHVMHRIFVVCQTTCMVSGVTALGDGVFKELEIAGEMLTG